MSCSEEAIAGSAEIPPRANRRSGGVEEQWAEGLAGRRQKERRSLLWSGFSPSIPAPEGGATVLSGAQALREALAPGGLPPSRPALSHAASIKFLLDNGKSGGYNNPNITNR